MSKVIEAGYATQIRKLRKRIQQLEMDKADPQDIKATIDSLRELESLLADERSRKDERRKVREEKIKKDQEAHSFEASDYIRSSNVKDRFGNPVDVHVKGGGDIYAYDSVLGNSHDSSIKDILRERFSDQDIMAILGEEPIKPKEEPASDPSTGMYRGKGDSISVEMSEEKAELTKFSLDDRVEPTRGTPGSWGLVMRYEPESDMTYVQWQSGKLADEHGFGAYNGSDLKKVSFLTNDQYEKRFVESLKVGSEFTLYRDIVSQENVIITAGTKGKILDFGDYAVAVQINDKKHTINFSNLLKFKKTSSLENNVSELLDSDMCKHCKNKGQCSMCKKNKELGDYRKDAADDYFPGERKMRDEREKRYQKEKQDMGLSNNDPVEQIEDIDKESGRNTEVVESFVTRSNPKAKSGNLYIIPKEDGWELVNYQTVIAKHLGDSLSLNNAQYSVTTSTIQRQIINYAAHIGLPVIDMGTGEPLSDDTERQPGDFQKLEVGEHYERLSSEDKEAVAEGDATPENVRKQWDEDLPHFGGGMPHRWQEKDDQGNVRCSYCFRPRDYKPGSPVRPEEIEELRQIMGSKKQADGEGIGYGGNRPGVWVSPKKDKDVSLQAQDEVELNMVNKKWVAKKSQTVDGGLGWAIFNMEPVIFRGKEIPEGTQVLVIKDTSEAGLTQPELEQALWDNFGKDLARVSLKVNLAVLKKGSEVRPIAYDAKRRELKFVSLGNKSISGWTSIDKFNFEFKKVKKVVSDLGKFYKEHLKEKDKDNELGMDHQEHSTGDVDLQHDVIMTKISPNAWGALLADQLIAEAEGVATLGKNIKKFVEKNNLITWLHEGGDEYYYISNEELGEYAVDEKDLTPEERGIKTNKKVKNKITGKTKESSCEDAQKSLEGSEVKDNVVRIKSIKILEDLAKDCPECFEKFLKFAEQKGMRIKADDLEEVIENIRERINTTKEKLKTNVETIETDADKKVEAADPNSPPEEDPGTGNKWFFNPQTQAWEKMPMDSGTGAGTAPGATNPGAPAGGSSY